MTDCRLIKDYLPIEAHQCEDLGSRNLSMKLCPILYLGRASQPVAALDLATLGRYADYKPAFVLVCTQVLLAPLGK